MLTREYLIEIRRRAIRKRLWFKVLDNIERDIFSLSVKVCKEIQSDLLNNQLTEMIAKLKNVLKSSFNYYFERFGIDRMITIQKQAMIFGYKEAINLDFDCQFLKYLIFLDYNQPIGWRKYS